MERIGKKIAESAYGLVGQAGFLMSGKDMKKCINQGTLSSCYNIGKMIREAAKAIQGGGGGQPGFAQAGGRNEEGISLAMEKMEALIAAEA